MFTPPVKGSNCSLLHSSCSCAVVILQRPSSGLAKVLHYFSSTGHCITKPEVIVKLEQDAEPWTVEAPPNQSLPGGSMRAGQGGWEEESTADVGLTELIFTCDFPHVQTLGQLICMYQTHALSPLQMWL